MVSFALSPSEPELKNIENRASELKQKWDVQSAEEAVKLYKQVSKNYSDNGNFEKAAECLFEIFELDLMLNNISDAEKSLRNVLSLNKKAKKPTIESQAYSNLVLLYLKANNQQKASTDLEKALITAEKSGDAFSLGLANLAAGEVYNISRKINEMITVQNKSLDYFRSANNKLYEAKILTFLSYSYSMSNNSELAVAHSNSAVEIQRKEKNTRGLALALIAGGDANQRIGNWQTAFDSLKEAQSLFSNDLDLADKAILFTKLGVHYETFGDMVNAFEYFKKAHELYEKGGDRIGYTELSIVLGQISMELEDFDNAIAYFLKGKAESEKINDKWSMALAFERLGQVYNQKNLHQQSIDNLKKALDLVKNEKNVKFREASIQFNLGKVYLNIKDYNSAMRYFSLAEQTNRKVNNIPGRSENLFNIASIEAVQGKIGNALKLVEDSLILTDKTTDQTANSKLRRTYFANVFDRYELYIDLLMKLHKQSTDGNYAVKALQAAEKSRARVLIENLSLSEADFTKDADPETIRRENEIRVLLNSNADKLTDLLGQNADKAETEKISIEINQLENELENIKARLKQQSPIYSAIKNPAPFDIGEFQQNILDENSLLLEFSFGEERSYLWLVGKDSVNSFVLPPRKEIETHIEKLRRSLASREMKKDEKLEDFQVRIREAETTYQTEAKLLSNQLFGQIADKISNKRLIIVPDGKLHYFPVSALPLPDSDSDEPLVTTNETVYAPSAQTLLILEKSRRQANEASKNLLIFSDPIFTSEDSRFSTANKSEGNSDSEAAAPDSFRFVESLKSLPRLTASKDESDAIRNIIGASNADSFSGFDANREQLLKIAASDYKILHFATHGITDEKRPELSGIILSRFNSKGQKQDEFFRIHDIYGLNLNADLVVLSACATGIGKEVKGEGLMSLNNAFLQTGAKSVMASLWKVEDTATQELMKRFYRGMVDEGLTPSQSLRQAQIELRKNSQFKSPFYWAAFTIQGDFRNVPKISKRFGNQIYLLAFIPLFLVGFYLFHKRKTFFRRSN